MEPEIFIENEGLRQESVVGPTLFNIVIGDIIKETNTKSKSVYIGNWNLELTYLEECVFADELVVFSKSEKELEAKVKI